MASRCFALSVAMALFALAACSPPVTPAPPTVTPPPRTVVVVTATTAPVTATATALPTPAPTPAPTVHRIGVRTAAGAAEFYDRETGARFVPRGNNLIRLARQQDANGNFFKYHSTFNVGLYDASRVEGSLQAMAAAGYNTVRVFIHGSCSNACLGNPAGGVSSAYVANLVDFLQRAQRHGLFVIITMDAEPGTPYYWKLLDTDWSEQFQGTNKEYLRRGGILAGRQFWKDLIAELKRQNAPFDALLAYELRNEIFFETNQPPLSLTKGVVETANGREYDMASPDDRQRMMDEGLVYYLDSVRAAILEVDPTALVAAGFFAPTKPNVWDTGARVIRTYPALWQSSLDFVDLHPYPGGLSLKQLVENFELQGYTRTPVLMGEFGAALSTYRTAEKAAQGLHDWQVESCAYGFAGWLLWTWDTGEQPEFYNGLSGDDVIHAVLAPSARPDPCRPGDFDFFEVNLALGKDARASRTLPEQPLAWAVDGLTSNWWGSGGPAPQWIEIDLGAARAIGRVRLVTSQSPAGATTHELWGGATRGALQLLHTFDGFTGDQQTLEFVPAEPWQDMRYLRVVTTRSPSWVSWREIEALAP